MPEKPSVPGSLADLVRVVGSPVTPEDIEAYGTYQGIVDRSHKLRTIVRAWERQEEEERALRRTYAKWLMWAVTGQGILVNAAFFLIGAGVLQVTEWVASIFIGSVFAEIIGLALLVVKYLFPEERSHVRSLLEQL